MADEVTNSTAEEIAGQVEGSVATLDNANQEKPQPKLVPEHDLLAVKDKAQRKENELKARIAELEASNSPRSSTPSIASLQSKYPDVAPEFIQDMASAFKAEAIQEAEAKVAPIVAQQKQEAFEKQWNKLFNDQLAKAEWIDKSKVDPEVIKALALSPKYRDSTSVKDIIEMVTPKVETQGRATTENDARPAMEYVSEDVDIKKITPAQLEKVLADPKAKKAYYAALDRAGL